MTNHRMGKSVVCIGMLAAIIGTMVGVPMVSAAAYDDVTLTFTPLSTGASITAMVRDNGSYTNWSTTLAFGTIVTGDGNRTPDDVLRVIQINNTGDVGVSVTVGVTDSTNMTYDAGSVSGDTDHFNCSFSLNGWSTRTTAGVNASKVACITSLNPGVNDTVDWNVTMCSYLSEAWGAQTASIWFAATAL